MLVVRGDGRREWLTTKCVGLGLSPKSEYIQASVWLAEGDRFLLYTDGATEARSVAGEEFGEERLAESLRGGTAAEMAGAVLAQVEEFTRGAPQHDDITLLAGCRML
jgi:sigma-B regulation protein RsbU (phosphoserine phosphatase)